VISVQKSTDPADGVSGTPVKVEPFKAKAELFRAKAEPVKAKAERFKAKAESL